MYLCVCVCMPEENIEFLPLLFSLYFLRKGLSLNLELKYSARLAPQKALGSLLSPSLVQE